MEPAEWKCVAGNRGSLFVESADSSVCPDFENCQVNDEEPGVGNIEPDDDEAFSSVVLDNVVI